MSRIETLVAVNAILLKDEKILLTRRSQIIREPGKWCLPGGHVEVGETWVSSLKREILEEIGVSIVNPRLLGVYSDPAITVSENPVRMDGKIPVFGHFVVAVFVSTFSGEIKTSEEVDAWDWFGSDDLPTPIIRSHPIRLSDYWAKNWGVVR